MTSIYSEMVQKWFHFDVKKVLKICIFNHFDIHSNTRKKSIFFLIFFNGIPQKLTFKFAIPAHKPSTRLVPSKLALPVSFMLPPKSKEAALCITTVTLACISRICSSEIPSLSCSMSPDMTTNFFTVSATSRFRALII
jgi:hypothetical protein